MNIVKTKEYLEYYEYVDSFCSMMRLAGFTVSMENRNTVVNSIARIIDKMGIPSYLEYYEGFSIGVNWDGSSILGTNYDMINEKRLKSVCEILFYTHVDKKSFEVKVKLYNEVLKDFKSKYDYDVENLYIKDFDTLKLVIERIAKSSEEVA